MKVNFKGTNGGDSETLTVPLRNTRTLKLVDNVLTQESQRVGAFLPMH